MVTLAHLRPLVPETVVRVVRRPPVSPLAILLVLLALSGVAWTLIGSASPALAAPTIPPIASTPNDLPRGDIPFIGDPIRDLTIWWSNRLSDASRAGLASLQGHYLTPLDPMVDDVVKNLYGKILMITVPLLTLGGMILGYLIMTSRTTGESAYSARAVTPRFVVGATLSVLGIFLVSVFAQFVIATDLAMVGVAVPNGAVGGSDVWPSSGGIFQVLQNASFDPRVPEGPNNWNDGAWLSAGLGAAVLVTLLQMVNAALSAERGGTYLELGAGAGLNPFALTGATGDVGLAAKLAALTRLIAAMDGGVSRDERPILDRALRAVYQAAGIGPDPASHDHRPPNLADLATEIERQPGGRPLAGRLERWASGSLAALFDAEGAPPLDRRMFVIGLAAISDPEVRSVAQLAALGVLWDAVRRDLEPKLVVVDEAWKVMRQPSGAEFVEELARSARHYHAGLQLATQDIVEFLRSDFGEPIVKQCDIRVLFGQAPEGADALARYFDLTTAERRLLLHARPGEGLPFVGRSHTAFEAVVAEREYAALTTRPADLADLATPMRSAPPDTG